MLKEAIDLSDRQRCRDNVNATKQTNFSIDHILNRAGNRVRHCDCSDANVSLTNQCGEFKQQFNNECLPVFSWLQYTRYRPPRLQRSSKLGPVKRTPGRLPRVPFTSVQLNSLEDAYKQSTYLSSEDANRLAESLDLTSTRVKIWFQNRRARERRETREADAGTLDLSISPDTSNFLHSSNIKCEIDVEKEG